MSGFKIGARQVGDGAPCLIVAEVGLAHDGSLAAAHSYIDAVAKAGADAVKFQCHLGDPVSKWRVKPPAWWPDLTREDYWDRTNFSPQEWGDLALHAKAKGLIFLCSPFSVEAVRMLEPLVPAWKIPSGLVLNHGLVNACLNTKKPIILSTGLSTWAEIQESCDMVRGTGIKHAILHCTSSYPTQPEDIGLMNMQYLRGAKNYPTGLSDHSGTIYPGLAAVSLGADILEVHVCFNRQQWGFDVESSITIDELARLVEGVRFIEKAKQPVDKDKLAEKLAPMRALFMTPAEDTGCPPSRLQPGDVPALASGGRA